MQVMQVYISSKMLINIYAICSLILISFSTRAVSQVQTLGNCDKEVNQCGQPLKDLNLNDDSHVVPAYTIKQAKSLCSTYEGVKACLNSIQHKCHDVERLFIRMGHLSFKYFCDDHFDEYIPHRVCLSSPKLHDEGKACNYSFYYSTTSNHFVKGTRDYQHDLLCPYIKTYLKCIYNLVDSFCGTQAAEWQRGLDEVSLAPATENIGCDLSGKLSASSSEQDLIVIACVVTFLLMLLLIGAGIAMWVYGRRKRLYNEQMRSELGQGPRASAMFSVPEGDGMQNGGVTLNPHGRSRDPISLIPPPYSEKPPDYDEGPSDGMGAQWSSMSNGAVLPEKRGLEVDLPPYFPGSEKEQEVELPPYFPREKDVTYETVSPTTIASEEASAQNARNRAHGGGSYREENERAQRRSKKKEHSGQSKRKSPSKTSQHGGHSEDLGDHASTNTDTDYLQPRKKSSKKKSHSRSPPPGKTDDIDSIIGAKTSSSLRAESDEVSTKSGRKPQRKSHASSRRAEHMDT